jgi:hypothetical protein
MRKAKNAIALALSLVASLAWGNGTSYSETTGKERTAMTVTIDKADDGNTITIESLNTEKRERYRIVADLDGNGKSMDYERPTKGLTTLAREGDTVLSGDGRAIAIGGAPWYPSIEYGIARLLAAGRDRGEFWVIEPETLKAHKMRAEVRGTETLSLGGKKLRAIAVRVTASGVPAVFFSMGYWFNETDYAFVKFEGVRGFGAPLTTIELDTEVR